MLRMFIALFVCCAIFVSASVTLADHSHEYEQASRAYAEGDYETAFHIWSEEAESGNPDAQEALAAMYAAGRGTQQNYKAAISWYVKAAEQGRASALFTLGRMYHEGTGVQKNPVKACAYFLISAANGNASASDKQRLVFQEMSAEQIEAAKEQVFELLKRIADNS